MVFLFINKLYRTYTFCLEGQAFFGFLKLYILTKKEKKVEGRLGRQPLSRQIRLAGQISMTPQMDVCTMQSSNFIPRARDFKMHQQ